MLKPYFKAKLQGFNDQIRRLKKKINSRKKILSLSILVSEGDSAMIADDIKLW